MNHRLLWLALTMLLVVALLVGCIPDVGSVPSSSRATTTPTPTRSPIATTTPANQSLPSFRLPPAPAPSAPYPIPPGSRVTRTGQVSTGAAVKVGSSTAERVESTLLSVGDTKSPLYGLELRIPAASHKDDRDYTVSYAPITNTTFKNVTPVSPLITIENGGGYADQLVSVKVPVKLAADDFAMGFYFDAKTGQLEGLPVIDYDANSITLATRHFSSIFASAIKASVLDAAILNGDIDSGFRPGMDDWQFINYGSYVAPRGHCAGQSISAMWYYVTRPDGPNNDLWGRYDRNGQKPATPAIWEDDSQAYRFASTVQKAVDWDGWQNKLFNELAGKSDAMTLRAFAYAMWVTGEPQYVGIRGSGGGHALVGYRVKDNKLYVSDPNIPGNGERRIEYISTSGKFKPYDGASKAGDPPEIYDVIRYVGKSAIIDWSIIPTRWQEMKRGAAGNDLFPAYTMAYRDEKNQVQELRDGMTLSISPLTTGPLMKNDADGVADFYRDGKYVELDSKGRLELKPGRNDLGAVIWVQSGKGDQYVDFTYFTVYYAPLAIDPAVIRAPVNQDCVFTASMPNAPAGVRYDWLVNGARQQTGPSVSFKFRSATAGTFDIGLKVYDGTGKELGVASASAVISAASPTATATPRPTTTTPAPTTTAPVSRLSQLQKKTVFSASVGTADGTLNYRIDYPGSSKAARTFTSSGGSWSTGVGGGIKITWSGSSFSGSDTVTSSTSTKVTTRTVNGTVSSDGNTITSLTFSVVSKWPESENKEYQVTAQNISLARFWGDVSGLQFISGAQAASVIGKVTEKTERAYSASTKSFTEVMTLTSIDWKSSDRNTAGASFE